MTIRYLATALVATLLWGIPASAQSAADLLQKGIYAQETMGDLDGAIKSYRQVLTSYPSNKQIAAQAQYQLVLCMVQKGDRAAAAREFDALARNYPDQIDIIVKARKLVPAGTVLLPAPWPDGEAFQLNVKRDGAFTGEYLFYSTGPNPYPIVRGQDRQAPTPDQAAMYWELVTKRSTRSVWVAVDRETMQPLDKPHLNSDDDMGDATAVPFAGPAIDLEPLVFRLRRLPLAVGYKTTLTTHPLVLGEGFPQQVELTVTGTETVQVVAGKFNCYKVSIGALNQTFWIGVDGARPLVKMQSGKAEAELVKVWGPSVFDSAMAFLKTAGWNWRDPDKSPGQDFQANVNFPDGQYYFSVHLRKAYTPPGDIAQALRQTMADKLAALAAEGGAKEVKVRPDSVQTRLIGGQQALICLIDAVDHAISDGNPVTREYHHYYAWVRTESTAVEFEFGSSNRNSLAQQRFVFEPILVTAKIP
ncbi:MAG: tetratricopeptide repeat protein [Bryobacteraceae bacterium]